MSNWKLVKSCGYIGLECEECKTFVYRDKPKICACTTREARKMKIYIDKTDSGKCQIRNDKNEVLHPKELTWHPDYQSGHDFMYCDDRQQAEKAVAKADAKFRVLGRSEVDALEVRRIEAELAVEKEKEKAKRFIALVVFVIFMLIFITGWTK